MKISKNEKVWLIVGVILAFLGNDLMIVSIACVLTVLLTEMVI